MKELSLEEKAKAYDEAKYIMKEYLESGNAGVIAENTIKKAFPELVESEDERMVKFIKNQLFNIKKTITDNYKLDTELTNAIDWLEKRGEKKPTWSEEDTQYINDTLALLSFGCSIHSIGEVQEWLQSLSNRVQLKQEWNYNDEIIIGIIIQEIEKIPSEKFIDNAKYRCLEWLRHRTKSLRPQSQWKPSEEQMDALRYVSGFDYGGHKATLVSLYEQLKKL